MKICFLLTWGDGMGGTEHAALTQAKHLAGRHQVDVISVFRTREAPFFAAEDVEMRYLVDARGDVQRPVRHSKLTDDECLALMAAGSELVSPRWEGSFNRLTDIELTHELPYLDADVLITTTPALTVFATHLGPPEVVLIQQEHRPSQFRGPTGEPLLANAPRLDALVVLTQRTKEWLEESLGTAAPRLETIPNAVPDGIRPRSTTRNPVIVMAGRLVTDKRMEHAIRAFDQLADDHPDWSLRIFGDGPEKNRLNRLVESLGRHDQIVLAGSSQHMAREWAEAGIAALSSKDGEAMPLVLLEAHAAGVPVVAYDIATGPGDIIRHDVDGLLVAGGDIDGLAAALRALMTDPLRRAEMGTAALERSQHFAAGPIVARWEDLFEELVAHRYSHERRTARVDRMGRRSAHGGALFHPAAPADRESGWRASQPDLERDLAKRARNVLVRSGGRLATVDDSVLHPQMLRRNLDLVVRPLEEQAVPHLVLPHVVGRPRVLVKESDRPTALGALVAAHRDEAVYAELLKPRLQAPGTVLAGLLETSFDVRGLRVFAPTVTSSRTLRYGPASGCDLEFWPWNAERESFIAPLDRTVRGDALTNMSADREIDVLGRRVASRSEFIVRDTEVVDAPIDAVWTWVDGGDPAWQERRRERLRQMGRAVPSGGGDERFRDRGELRYSMRSFAMFAPWVRHHYVVTDMQTPEWLNADHPDVTVVDHREIFSDPSHVPSFNSHAIGSQLHHIDGLAEQFLTLNDDLFLGGPLAPSAFFTAGGAARSFPSPTQIPLTETTEDEADYLAGRKNARRLVEERFGRTLTHGYLHAPVPCLRSLLGELEAQYEQEWRTTAGSPFRAASDVTILSCLQPEVGALTNRFVRSALRVAYVDTSRREHQAVLTRLLVQRNADAFCLNDGSNEDVTAEEQARVVQAFLGSYFPVPAPWER